MHIPIWLLAIVGVIGFIFLTPYRQALINIFSAIRHLFCGAAGRLWDFIRGASPAGAATSTILGYIGMALMFVALAIILIVMILYFIIGGSIMAIGIATGNWKVALILLLVLSLWGILSMFPPLLFFKPLNWASRWLARPVAIGLAIFLLVDIGISGIRMLVNSWSPEVVEALDERHQDVKVATGNSLRKAHALSERNTGVRGFIKDATCLYDDFGKPVKDLKAGDEVMVLDLEGEPATENAEAALPVMVANEKGDFFKGRKGWVPAAKIIWEKTLPNLKEVKTEEKSPAPAEVPAASSAPKAKGKLCWEKPDGYKPESLTRSRCDVVEISFPEQGCRIEIREIGSVFTLKGERAKKNTYQGKWKNLSGEEGNFSLIFSPDQKLASGWQKDEGSQVEVYTWLTKM